MKDKKKKKGKPTDPEKIEYAEEVSSYDVKLSFQDMNLSRPLLKVRDEVQGWERNEQGGR